MFFISGHMAGFRMGDKIMQVNSSDMTMVTKKNEDVRSAATGNQEAVYGQLS